MDARKLTVGLLAVLACSRSVEDAGIVLNIDAEVTEDRTAINRITVTVDGRKQEWSLTQALPGSLGIVTNPGSRSVTVDGYASSARRGTWSGVIVASKGKVVVQDVHLVRVGSPVRDASLSDSGLDGARDGAAATIDGRGGEAGGAGGVSGAGGTSGRFTVPPFPDSGAGGIAGAGGGFGGTGGGAGRDAGDTASPTDVADGYDGPSAPLTGAFAVASQFEIPAAAAAPGPLGDTLDLVHGLVDDPGGAIIGFADDVGVPGLGSLRSVLPDALESRLTGWMNSYIKSASVAGVTPYDQLVWLDNTIRTLLIYWGLQSQLTLPVDQSGTHAPVTLVFAGPAGSPLPIPVDPTAAITSGVGVTARLSWPNGATGPAVVTISDHFMGLPFGRYALLALNQILLAEYGAPNLAAFLANAVGCSGMADYIASQCVLGVCVGHGDDLLDVCSGGLGEGARQIENQIRDLDFKAIHFQQGTATAVGATIARPQDATAFVNGTWTVTVDFGSGPEPATATFVAVAASP